MIRQLEQRLVDEGFRDKLGSAFRDARPPEIVPTLLENGVPANVMARLLSEIFEYPLAEGIDPGVIRDRGIGWLVTQDGCVYLSNPLDADLIRQINNKWLPIISGWGMISADEVRVPGEDDGNNVADVVDLIDKADEEIARIMQMGIDRGVSDIHLQPLRDSVMIRVRQDGEMVRIDTIPRDETYRAISNRIMDKSGLNGGEFNAPQSGKFRWPYKNKFLDVRMEMAPARTQGDNSPKFTLRLMGQDSGLVEIDRLGIPNEPGNRQLLWIRRLTKEANGIILVTGPTGSGKSTTLMAVLRLIKNLYPGKMIYTLEDPVEREEPGLCQIEINSDAGMTFSSGLRSLLRHDPDVILVGEIRDKETLDLAIEASLTGHLVLSTLHTNSAIEAIPRMLNKGVDPDLLADSIRAITAQRMVRRVCPHCSIEMEYGRITSSDLAADQEVLDILKTEEQRDRYRAAPHRYGKIPFFPRAYDKVRIAGDGCDHCDGQGYKGRHLVSELLLSDHEIKAMIARRENTEVIRRHLEKNHFPDMWHHAGLLISRGVTTLDEAEMRLNVQRDVGESFDYNREEGFY